MDEANNFKSGDMFFDRRTGFVYVISNFQHGRRTKPGFSNEPIYLPSGYRVYQYGKPPKGKYIQFFTHQQLSDMIKTESPQAAKILFGENVSK